MNKLLTLFLFALLTLFVLPNAASADSGCDSSKGGAYGAYGSTCPSVSINLNKTVKNPSTGEYIDNMGTNSPHFLPGQNVNFRVKVQNTGNTVLTSFQVQDKFPDFTDFVSGPGKFDTNTKTLTFTIDKLKPNEFREYDVVGKIKPSEQISGSLNCVSNYAQVSSNNQFSSDTATFCIETKVLAPVQELPKTGPVSTAAIFLGSASLLMASLLIFRKSGVK